LKRSWHICPFPFINSSKNGLMGREWIVMGDTMFLLLVAVAAFLLGRLSASVKVVGFRTKLDDPEEPRRGMARSFKGE
jgi:hypothetical protein